MSKQFAEFRVGDLVTMETHRLHNSDDVSDKGTTPYITRSTLNNGLSKFAKEDEIKDLVSGNAITVAGESSKLFYQPVNFIVGTKVAVLRYPQINQYNAQYMITCIEKATMSQYGFSNILTGNRVVEATIQLPITDSTANTPNPEPDWEYMENYIKTIERKFIDQIAEHNSREQAILEQLHPESVNTKPEAYGFKDFEIGEVFEVVTGSLVGNLKQGDTPRITPSSKNNGVSLFTTDSNPQARYFNDIITVSFLGDVFYQRQKVSLEMKVHGLKLKEGIGFKKGSYIATSVKKSISERYDYGSQLSSEKLETIPAEFPITPTGAIDWDYMEQYITWVEARERESRELRALREEKILEQLHKQH